MMNRRCKRLKQSANWLPKTISNGHWRAVWRLTEHGCQRWFDLADGRTREEERSKTDGYLDSQ